MTHRDLKPENILLGDNFKIKLADFGFAAELSKNRNNNNVRTGLLDTQAGTESYMAPELLLGLDYNGTSVDLFAAGIILFIMVTGVPPFEEARPQNEFYKMLCTNKEQKFWEAHLEANKMSNDFIDLMNVMLTFDPNQRMTFSEIIYHPWMTCGGTVSDEEMVQELSRRH